MTWALLAVFVFSAIDVPGIGVGVETSGRLGTWGKFPNRMECELAEDALRERPPSPNVIGVSTVCIPLEQGESGAEGTRPVEDVVPGDASPAKNDWYPQRR